MLLKIIIITLLIKAVYPNCFSAEFFLVSKEILSTTEIWLETDKDLKVFKSIDELSLSLYFSLSVSGICKISWRETKYFT